MKKLLLLSMSAAFIFASCKKESDYIKYVERVNKTDLINHISSDTSLYGKWSNEVDPNDTFRVINQFNDPAETFFSVINSKKFQLYFGAGDKKSFTMNAYEFKGGLGAYGCHVSPCIYGKFKADAKAQKIFFYENSNLKSTYIRL